MVNARQVATGTAAALLGLAAGMALSGTYASAAAVVLVALALLAVGRFVGADAP